MCVCVSYFSSILNHSHVLLDFKSFTKIRLLRIESKRLIELIKSNNIQNLVNTHHSKMKVTIRSVSGEEIQLEVEPSDTVEKLKESIQGRKGISPDQQFLIFAGRRIDDGQTLAQHKVRNGSTILLVLKSGRTTHPTKEAMTVHIKTLGKETFDIEVEPNDTVETLKRKIQFRKEVPVDQQRLIQNEKQLEDGRTLAECGIQEGDTIYIILRLRGDKPVILFYPPSGTTLSNVTVSLKLDKGLAFTAVYPKPQKIEGTFIMWKVSRIEPDGTLTLEDDTRTKCAYLFWEFTGNPQSTAIDASTFFEDPSSTMLTEGARVAEFLARLLDALGLTPRERDDMVTYWLHSVQGTMYLLVRVAKQSELCSWARLGVRVEDASVKTSVHRVYILLHPCKKVGEEVAAKMLREPCIPSNIRDEFPIVRGPSGLTVVEWGGVVVP